MHRITRFTGAALAVLTLACDTPIAAPDTAVEPFAASATHAGVIASATGAAHRIRGGEVWVLSFNAIKRADGHVTGQYRVDRKDIPVSFNVDVTCMSVSGNTAWIAGIIRNQSGDIAVNGTVSYFYVIDNGEGPNGGGDIVSALRLNDVAGEDVLFCEDQPLLLPSAPVELGTVTVRGEG
jgi:hypothetical protein